MPIIIVMGVAGCGKSSVGEQLATRLNLPFIEGDDHHPPANVQKMANGHPLDDSDRQPWLAALVTEIQANPAGAVLSCSALKTAYRKTLKAVGNVVFVYLEVSKDTADARLRQRDHFFSASLLDSQFATLQAPTAFEAITIDANRNLDEIVELILNALPA